MGSQIHTSNDRSRTNWTAETERYFIDLMLDQVHRGNRMGHTFNKQAWNDMLIMFNSNFGSPYDVNILKSRYTNLWKQFNDIRNLLEQNGFSWDTSRQMVIADNSSWETYIKAHPDAQFYRNRTLMNFNDLCLIFAHTTADGRYSLSSHDIDFDDDIQVMSVGVGMNSLPLVNKECLKTDWTLAMDQYFVKLMRDQLEKGNKINNTFSKQAWKDMVALFNAEFGCQYGKSFLRNRYKKLFKYYTDVRNLLDENGFSWDGKRQKVVASDDAWDDYIEAHPDARGYRRRTLLNYRDLDFIYGNTISNVCNQMQQQMQFEDGILGEIGEEREGYSSADYGYWACQADLDSEGPDLMMGFPWLEAGEDFQCKANGDCLSTHWTPQMDRHLLDLMLKEGHKVKSIDYSFNNLAWMDMIASFKERFGLHYDKDFFQARYRSLEKLYHDMRNSLNMRGSWWDETRHVVRAHDDTWDAYIKEYPHAKSFRTDRKPNYNDLCLIFRDSTSNGRHHESGQDARLNNSYYWKSDWTPPMDRRFINLMLEQVRVGSMVDKKFNKLAWDGIVSKFIAEFGFQHDTDVLESRFLNLRKRFNDMKTLLDQSGFDWDEMRQMIVADNDLWDAYIKEHPNARSYRNRTLPNFNDLFLIFGNNNAEKSQQCPTNSTEADDNDRGVDIEDSQSPLDSYPPRMRWTKAMDHCFIDLMLEEVRRGNKTVIAFNERAWARMITSFNKKLGLICNKDELENRYLSLMKECKDVKNILNRNGFAWDEFQQSLTADDDVWKDYIEEHPEGLIYKDRILDSYEDLCLIFADEVPDRRRNSLGIKMKVEDNALKVKRDDHDVFRDLEPPSREFEIFYERKKRKSTTSSNSAGKRKVPRTMEDKREAADQKPIMVRELASDVENRDFCSIESIVAALQTVPDMDDELFLQACEVLEDEKKAKMFIAMDVTARKKWLLRKLYR